MTRIHVVYVTSSDFKKEEASEIFSSLKFNNGISELPIGDKFELSFSGERTDEPLEIDLADMVRVKAGSAYKRLLVPCIVEHAGLIVGHLGTGFPGGLTQPMWDSLGAARFLRMIGGAGTRAVARAVVGYCDGMSVHVFVGETEGFLAIEPLGGRRFYWDRIFCPDGGGGLTYAQLVERRGLGAKLPLSQSYLAIRNFLQFRATRRTNDLFDA